MDDAHPGLPRPQRTRPGLSPNRRVDSGRRVQRIASATVGRIGRPPVEKNIVMNEIDRMDCSNNPFWRTMLTVRNGPNPISRITGRIGSTVRRRPRTLQRPRANSPAEGRKNRLRFAIAYAVSGGGSRIQLGMMYTRAIARTNQAGRFAER